MLGSKKKEEAFPVNEALLNVITPMGLEIKRNSLVIGENLGKVYGAVRYPQKVDMGWLSKITNIDGSGQSYEGIIFTDGVTEVVYYNQLDERWADLPYGTDNIGGYGCGPTSMAIVVSSLTDQTVDPPTMAEWAYQNGYWCSGNGSYHSLIPGAAEGFGLQWESISTDDPQAVVDALASGKLIVALMSKGHFTSSGHFMVLRGVTSEGKILVADPASKKRSEQEWDISIILDEARKGAAAGGPLWAIY